MKRLLVVIVSVLLLPSITSAAPSTFSAARSLLSASSTPGNSYVAGATVVTTAPVVGDLSAFGGSVITAASVTGDETVIGGSVHSRARVGGDLRAIGGSIIIDETIIGDLVAFGLSVHDSSRAGGSVFIIAANTTISRGAKGPVTIYGNNVSLAGDFAGDVDIVASGRVTLAASTTIAGALTYQAPDEASIPTSAVIRGGVSFSNASYLPDAGTSRILGFISMGIFLLVRILGALILAGLLAGLFPRLAEEITEMAKNNNPRRTLLTMLLGFAIFVVTPVLLVLLAITFVGIGLALLILIVYACIVLLSLIYAGILLGSILSSRFSKRDNVLWHDGVLGMLVLSLITLVPVVGTLFVVCLTTFTAGSLIIIFFNFAFPHEEHTQELL